MPDVQPADCPFCGALLDAASFVQGDDSRAPSEGDVTICLYCARPLVFDADLIPRRPTTEEYVEIMKNPVVRRAVSLVKAKGPRAPGRRP